MDQAQNPQAVSKGSVHGTGPGIGQFHAAMQKGEATHAASSLPEQDLWSGRMHWQNGIGRVLSWLFLNIGIVIGAYYFPRPEWLSRQHLAWTVLAIFAISALIMLGGLIVRILQTRYRLSSQRLFIERGVLSRTMDQTELIRVDDVRTQQSFINRIFNIGTVFMMTTDATDRSVAIVGIKDPIRVTELIRQQMRTLRAKSLFVESL